jgi:hypothetical protein
MRQWRAIVLIRLQLLHHAAEGLLYGLSIIEELA